MTLRKFAWAVGAVALSISGATATSQAEERQITTHVTLGATSDYMFARYLVYGPEAGRERLHRV